MTTRRHRHRSPQLFLLATLALAVPAAAQRIELTNWTLQSSAQIKDTGDKIAAPGYAAQGWRNVKVPTTVAAALVDNQELPDPYFGDNIRKYPGADPTPENNFSNDPMPPGSPFAVPWWYRTEFDLPSSTKGKHVQLHFDGVNYRANVWVNGKRIAYDGQIAGAWRRFELDVTEAAKPGERNVLAVEVFAPKPNDLAITFVDWNPLPPDKNMGLWMPVYLTTSGPVTVRHPFVETKLAGRSATLTVHAELANHAKDPVQGTLRGKIGDVTFSQPFALAAGETKPVAISPQHAPGLNIANPRLWWPAQMGKPELYDLELSFDVNNAVSDSLKTTFGIREVTADLDQEKKRLAFKINGKPILIRGGGWTSEMMMRSDPQRTEQELRYTHDMGLNTIRLEGKFESDYFYDLTDRMGILVMTGWCCCDHWEKWENWKSEDFHVAEMSQRDQLLRVRNRPSILAWFNASDMPPAPDVERAYIRVLKELNWPTPYISSATAKPSQVTGPTGVKMNGPYDWIPPNYWLADQHQYGGAWSFATEIGPGPAIPEIESLRQMMPEKDVWPMSEMWRVHAGLQEFKDIDIYHAAQEARYGPSNTAEEYTRKAQAMAYEAQRAMFEGFSRNKYDSTGVIQWMLNDAWPKIIWHLYDFYLRPGGGYFGTKAANQPLLPMYSYHDRSVWLVSSQYQDAKRLKVTARVFDLNAKERFSKQATIDAAADSTQKLFDIPAVANLTPTYFLKLTVTDAAGKEVGSNFYWLSTKEDVLDWGKGKWFYTPTSAYADFTTLNRLPKTRVTQTAKTERDGDDSITRITLRNSGKSLAFMVRMKLMKGNEEVLPVLWSDNYISLLPGETREITASAAAADFGGAQPTVAISGWNLETR